MATRYCGKIKIDCKLVESNAPGWNHGAYYLCSLYKKYNGERKWSKMWNEHVGLPAVLRHPIDSSAAYDEAVHAALSFATDEGKLDDGLLDFTDSGYRIRRKPAR